MNSSFMHLCEEARLRVREMMVREVRENLSHSKHYLIDVREESEWLAGHAVGAIHLSKGVIERDIEGRIPDREATLMLYCGGGARSLLAADNLLKMGYRHVYSIHGGWHAWQQAGYPTTTLPEVLPRSPYQKLGGLYYLPRLIDKCRLAPQGKLMGYTYLVEGMDKLLLDFLCIEGRGLEQVVNRIDSDEDILGWLKTKLGPGWPSDHSIQEFNHRLARRRPETPEQRASFERRISHIPFGRRKVETYMDLIDLEEGRPLHQIS